MAEEHTRGTATTPAVAGQRIPGLPFLLPVDFLVGMVGSLLTDLGYWWTADPLWARLSLWLIGGGLATGALATLARLDDLAALDQALAYADGRIHFLGNAMAVVLGLVSLLLRLDDAVAAVLPWGLVLSAITVALLAITGWYGGELAYRYIVSLSLTAREGERRTWQSSEEQRRRAA